MAHDPKFHRIIQDFHHFLNIREDNHKYIEHLFMERLKVEAKLLEKLEFEIEEMRVNSLKNCPYCGIMRPKRYNRSSQTTRELPKTLIVSRKVQSPKSCELTESISIEDRLNLLNDKMDKMSCKTDGMLKRSRQLHNRSDQLNRHIDFVREFNKL